MAPVAGTTEYTPTQLAAHIRKVWSKEIGLTASEEQVLVPQFAELEQIEGQLVFRKFGILSTNSLGDTLVGENLVRSGQTEITVPVLPQTEYVCAVVNFNTAARCAFDPKVPLREQMEAAMYERVDRVAANVATGLSTSIVGGPTRSLDDPLIREAKRKLITAAKSAYKVKKDKFVVVIHPQDFENLDGIEAFYRADFRGDAETPLVSGAVYQVRGGYWMESGNILQDSVTRNLMFIPKMAFGIGYNKKYAVKMEEFELIYKLIAWVDFGVMERWDEYAVAINTQV
jgi:hypothetical protein